MRQNDVRDTIATNRQKKFVLEQNDLWVVPNFNHYFQTSKHQRQIGHLD